MLSYDESIILFSNYAERLGCAMFSALWHAFEAVHEGHRGAHDDAEPEVG